MVPVDSVVQACGTLPVIIDDKLPNPACFSVVTVECCENGKDDVVAFTAVDVWIRERVSEKGAVDCSILPVVVDDDKLSDPVCFLVVTLRCCENGSADDVASSAIVVWILERVNDKDGV